ncbi:MAG TPA: TetR/AcrR family transcriptional regulator [Solirubrobacterales bacterium]
MSYLNGSGRGRDPARERLSAAIVDLVGSHGFSAIEIETLCERAHVNRGHFSRCFADLEDCFLSVHDEVAADFCARVTSAHEAAATWHDRIWAAGWAAMRYLQEDPVRARFLLVAVNGAGSGAQDRRDRIMQSCADLLDGGRGEAGKRGPMSRCTAEIAAGAIYGTILAKIESGAIERGEEFLSELIYMAVMPYLGSRAAEDELAVQPLH